MNDEPMHGGCLCGTVRFTAHGAPRWVAHCHCESCRRATSAAFATYVGYAADAVQWSVAERSVYHSSPGVERTFCATCGAALTYASDRWPDEIHLFACSFDEPGRLVPGGHVFIAERLPWVHLADGLPEFEGTSG